MQERLKPPASLGSPLEQVQRRRAAALDVGAPVTLGRVPVVEDFDVNKELEWLMFRDAWTVSQHENGSAYLDFGDAKVSDRFRALTQKESSDSQFSEGCRLAAREFALGRARFLSKDEVAQRIEREQQQ